uniref:Chaperone DnaJ-class protein n=1 Tax=Clandestinovirus TaxID=2831644 RepID=A0A8F8KRW7_9VIRU|nr:chaperone DnaJ-class protein [Clandestinovirus]
MADDFDPYKILGVGKNASKEEILKSFKDLAKKWHPDRNGDNPAVATEMMKKVNQAKEILTDEHKRSIYDRYGMKGLTDPDSVQASPMQRILQMNPLNASVIVDFALVESGGNVTVDIERHIFRKMGNQLNSVGTEVSSINVPIPPGVIDSMTLTVQGEGHRIEGEVEKGPVRIMVKVKKHPRFNREGAHIVCNTEVSLTDILIPTMFEFEDSRNNKFYVPYDPTKDTPITPSDNIRIVQGKGLPEVSDPGVRGDYYIVFDIVLPSPSKESLEMTINSIPKKFKALEANIDVPESAICSMITKAQAMGDRRPQQRKGPQVGCVQQ